MLVCALGQRAKKAMCVCVCGREGEGWGVLGSESDSFKESQHVNQK